MCTNVKENIIWNKLTILYCYDLLVTFIGLSLLNRTLFEMSVNNMMKKRTRKVHRGPKSVYMYVTRMGPVTRDRLPVLVKMPIHTPWGLGPRILEKMALESVKAMG